MTNNVDRSLGGLVPCGANGSGEYKGKCSRYVHAATDNAAVYKWQAVKMDGGSDAATGLRTVVAAGDTDTPCGICVGVENEPTDLSTQYCPASTRRIILVEDDPNVLFTAIGDDVGTTLDATHAGSNVTQESSGITSSTVTGQSLHRLDSSTVNTTNTLTIRLVKLLDTAGQNIADGDKYKTWVCQFNLHQHNSTTGI